MKQRSATKDLTKDLEDRGKKEGQASDVKAEADREAPRRKN